MVHFDKYFLAGELIQKCLLLQMKIVQYFNLEIQPIIHFKYNCPVPVFKKRIAKIVIRVNDKKITHRFIAPLETAVDINVIFLCVVLNECCPENTIAEIYFYFWSN